MPTDTKKKYGLILASARRAEALSASRREGMRTLKPLKDSDEELERGEEENEHQEESMDWVQATLKKSGGGNSAQLAQQQRLMREALQEDPSVFQYDEHYDNMQTSRDTDKQEKTTINKQPKYIHNILKTAERRKIEKERRTERKVQAERVAEKGLYDDKESFVTSSYLSKLEELKEADEQDKYEQMLEEKTDVAKHKNMGIFYDHIFKQRMGEQTTDIKTEPKETNEDDSIEPQDMEIKKRNEKSKSNKYRKRETSRSPEREEINLDADTDVEIDTDDSGSTKNSRKESEKSRKKRRYSSSNSSSSCSSSEEEQSNETSTSKSKRKAKSLLRNRTSDSESVHNISSKKIKEEKKESSGSESDADIKKRKEVKKEPKETKEERIKKLFTKRTVGDKFIEAQQKYFQRKAARLDTAASA